MGSDSRVGTPAFEDLTARARIREAALRHFADHGFAKTSIRAIAKTAGVSSGLVRHHFGSKDGLRRACDEYVLDALRQVNERLGNESNLGDPIFTSGSRRALSPFQSYVARALVEGSETASSLFDQMVPMIEKWLETLDAGRDDVPAADRRTRAALIIAMKMAIPVMHEHVSRAMDVDIFSDEGDRQVVLGLLDIFSHPLISVELADKARSGFEAPRRESAP
ncbi:TetR/AcrR family transcriptional regulator [Actinomadura sp. 9N215]|uniref:TetR/AcrR family transcriptional regulator n=1 Tax=Actinomadura sp. 9N215 TaxID=3375150 RepID=UPI0037B77918